MAAEYHCLVAGLTEYSFADKNRNIELVDLRREIAQDLSKDDRKSLSLLYSYYDIQNTINMLQSSSLPFNQLGNLTREQIEAEIAAEQLDEEPFESLLPPSVRLTLDKLAGKNLADEEQPIAKEHIEQVLYNDFYTVAAASRCTFIKEWCEADRTIRNISTLHRAEELGVDGSMMTIGETTDEREFDYYNELMSVLDTKDFIERETKMDALRWQIAETIAEHNYFDVAAVLSYMVKLNILYRWSALDKQVGEERFRSIVESFTAHTKIE